MFRIGTTSVFISGVIASGWIVSVGMKDSLANRLK